MAEQVSPAVLQAGPELCVRILRLRDPWSQNKHSLTDATGTPSQPTKTPINESSPISEEDAAREDKDFVERHIDSLDRMVIAVHP